MRHFSANITFTTKLVLGFVAVSMIACAVGVVGWWCLALLGADLNDLAGNVNGMRHECSATLRR